MTDSLQNRSAPTTRPTSTHTISTINSQVQENNKRTVKKRRRDEDLIDSSDDYTTFEGNTGKRRKAKEGLLGVHIGATYGFACPFYKRGELPGHSACAGPGWPNVTRML